MLKFKNIAFNNKIHLINNSSVKKIGIGVIFLFKKDLVSKFKILYKDDNNSILLIKLWLKDSSIINIASIYDIPNQDIIQNRDFCNLS